jgi:class 3 adenylate cyclase
VRDLPTGTVTLLFTDIADSTPLMLTLGDRYPVLLEECRRVLRETAHDHGGDEVETVADNCLFVFRGARVAVEAAADAQRSLHAHDWPDAAHLRVAIGLHTGEPIASDDGYTGVDVYRVTLVCAQAGPGQVLVSEATRQLIQDDLPQGMTLGSLGERQLGRLERPERLYQLEIEGLPSEQAVVRRGLPAGTVTFLFSDIESSTELMRALGDDWAGAHAEHRRLLRDAFRQAGGREVDTQGDAFFAVFPRARAALEAAASAQRSLQAHDWPAGQELRVRIGIHTGEPTIGEEGYLGLDVVRGARICSAAHGGQILVSETTRALVRGDEPTGLELRDLGEHHLKDLDHAERLFQLVAPGLEDEFAAPRSLDTETAPPVPLPALRIPVRERELAEQALAAAEDLDALGPSIERQVEEALRAAGVPAAQAPAPRAVSPLRGARAVGLGWALAAVAVGAVAVWLLTRFF